MRQATVRSLAYYVFYGLQISAIAGSALLGPLLRADIEKAGQWLPILGKCLDWVQESGWWLVLGLALTIASAKVACSLIGQPWVWQALHSILDEFQKNAFRIEGNDPLHYHRVTLFRRVRFRWLLRPRRSRWWPWGTKRMPWSGWLVPVLRSGHTTQRTDAAFLAPDDADNAEGIVGQTWSCRRVLFLENLPNLEGSPSEADIVEYAHKTWVSKALIEDRLRRRKPCARSFCGIPVEVKGKPWGAIVLDSRSGNGILNPDPNWPPYRLMSLFLGKLVEKA
jgi:hypothetical protein